jgi:glucose-6-phosphate isomerase
MSWTNEQLWDRFKTYYTEYPTLGLALDASRMNFPDDFWPGMEPRLKQALADMAQLEGGVEANSDEKRMVGHYWLRNPVLAPKKDNLREEIEKTVSDIKVFAKEVHKGVVSSAKGKFKFLLVIGIGGSALGPQFVANALTQPGKDKMEVFFFDNTDPDGMDKVLAKLKGKLNKTLVLVISKSGGTKETRNGMLEAKRAYEQAGLTFAQHAVAITGANSELDKLAVKDAWLRRFPMWDWVGGRTSETSAVGLLPAALQGFNINELLAGAAECDEVTRNADPARNPAAQLAALWYYAGQGRGAKDMVILPYKDRLELFSRYLQQLIMESLGKELDIKGNVVHQGIAVYGNKGSTDQHAYIQQLRDGLNNFFVTFIEVLRDRSEASMLVEENVTSGDYLEGFFLGTRKALHESNRESVTLTIDSVSAFSVGVLIALFERAVGLYASLIHINAYHQPGVEAGKKAAGGVIAIQGKILGYLQAQKGQAFTAEQIAAAIGATDANETVFKVLEHLAANPDRLIKKARGNTPFTATYARVEPVV